MNNQLILKYKCTCGHVWADIYEAEVNDECSECDIKDVAPFSIEDAFPAKLSDAAVPSSISIGKISGSPDGVIYIKINHGRQKLFSGTMDAAELGRCLTGSSECPLFCEYPVLGMAPSPISQSQLRDLRPMSPVESAIWLIEDLWKGIEDGDIADQFFALRERVRATLANLNST